MKKIIVTGGSGFIGSHIVERLAKAKYNVTVVDLWESEEIKTLKNNQKNVNFIKLDVADVKKLEEILSQNDHIIHLAAILGTSETITTYDVEDVVKTNVLGTTKILKLCKKYNYKKVVVPTTPDVTWLNPYKITKQAVERLVQLFNLEYGLNSVCMKLGNIYGPRERWLQANFNAPFNYQKVVPSFIMDTLMEKSITIYGDGKQKSEYIFVEDVVESFHRAIDYDKKFGTEVIHVGSGQNQSVIDIIDALEKAWNRKLDKNFVDMRPGEHKIEINLNPEPLKKILGYSLQWDLEKGLKSTIPYYEKEFAKTK
jgi:nucleoside-diphosphate-sugar epimerase